MLIKVECPECGQRYSGDETFYGRIVDCVCGAKVHFPEQPSEPETISLERKKEEPAESGGPEAPVPAPEPERKRESRPDKPAETVPPREKKEPKAVIRRETTGAAAAEAPPAETGPAPLSAAAVWSAILGVAAFVFFPLGPLLALPAIVCGHSARSGIRRSRGKRSGDGLATAGLMLGYFFLLLVFLGVILLSGDFKRIAAFFFNKYNESAAITLLQSLRQHAEANDGAYPESLGDLVPDTLSQKQYQAALWTDPDTLQRKDFLYFPERAASEDPAAIVIAAPAPDADERRLVGSLQIGAERIREADFQNVSSARGPP